MLVTISDKKLGYSSNDSTVDYFNPQVVSAQDYYPFGMLQPGRELNVSGYRYGFNGKENDNEVKGEGNQQDYGMRIYDPRLGRFLSVDPLSKSFAFFTPYQFSSNSPIANVDLDGGESKYYIVTDISIYQNEKFVSNTTTVTENTAKSTGLFPHGPLGPIYVGPGGLGNGILFNFYEEKHTLKDEAPNYFNISPTYENGALYIPAAGDNGARGGLYFVSESGGYGHASGDLDKADAIPINLDLLVAAAGGFPGGGSERYNPVEEIMEDPELLGKISKILEQFKFGQETAGRNLDLYQQLDAYLNNIVQENEKRKIEEKDKALELDASKFFKKGTIYYDPNLRHNIERDTDTIGQLTDKKAKDTLPTKKR